MSKESIWRMLVGMDAGSCGLSNPIRDLCDSLTSNPRVDIPLKVDGDDDVGLLHSNGHEEGAMPEGMGITEQRQKELERESQSSEEREFLVSEESSLGDGDRLIEEFEESSLGD